MARDPLAPGDPESTENSEVNPSEVKRPKNLAPKKRVKRKSEPEPQPQQQEITGSMTLNEIKAAGLMVDLPFETAEPKMLKYKTGSAQEWVPPSGWRQGMPPIDPLIAERLGVPRDLSEADKTIPSRPPEEGLPDEGTQDTSTDTTPDEVGD
jgi:hypothetical protein